MQIKKTPKTTTKKKNQTQKQEQPPPLPPKNQGKLRLTLEEMR